MPLIPIRLFFAEEDHSEVPTPYAPHRGWPVDNAYWWEMGGGGAEIDLTPIAQARFLSRVVDERATDARLNTSKQSSGVIYIKGRDSCLISG